MLVRLALNLLVAAAAATPVVQKRQGGFAIASCTNGGVALTFDDGPFAYTDSALSQLAAGGHRATFFLNGQNWGSIWDYQPVVQRMINEGHQVGSHTWSHPDLATLGWDGISSQMSQLDDALSSIIGKRPTYMRPPYFSWTQQTLDTLASLGYKVIHASIDTNDWDVPNIGVQGAINNFVSGLNAGGSITLAHDVHAATVNEVLPAILSILNERGIKSVPVGECLGDDPANWYR